jgi:hypothetical protein
MSLQYVANSFLMTVELGAGYVATSGTMVLSAGEGSRLPATGDFWIRQSNVLASTAINILKVTARTGDTLTVVGGQDGTIDQNIANGTVMTWALTVSALNLLVADILAQTEKVITQYDPGTLTAGVGAANLTASALASLYQVNTYVQVLAANATDAFLTITIGWTFNGVARTLTAINSINLSSANLAAESVHTLRSDVGTAITRTITADSGTYQYRPFITLLKVG